MPNIDYDELGAAVHSLRPKPQRGRSLARPLQSRSGRLALLQLQEKDAARKEA